MIVKLYGKSMNEEERIIRLEEEFYFQKKLLDDLHTVLANQQKQLDAMELLVQKQQVQLEEIRDILLSSKSANQKPPHYLLTP